ncbi:hypothetical protein C8R43DRAFT_945843 [Mycena crocata]|nr:hypothetical protein C8R43DRAFT_945843 [Mycena crocata]
MLGGAAGPLWIAPSLPPSSDYLACAPHRTVAVQPKRRKNGSSENVQESEQDEASTSVRSVTLFCRTKSHAPKSVSLGRRCLVPLIAAGAGTRRLRLIRSAFRAKPDHGLIERETAGGRDAVPTFLSVVSFSLSILQNESKAFHGETAGPACNTVRGVSVVVPRRPAHAQSRWGKGVRQNPQVRKNLSKICHSFGSTHSKHWGAISHSLVELAATTANDRGTYALREGREKEQPKREGGIWRLPCLAPPKNLAQPPPTNAKANVSEIETKITAEPCSAHVRKDSKTVEMYRN